GARRAQAGAQPSGAPDRGAGDGRDLRPAVHAAAASALPRADPAHTMIKDSVQIMRGCFGGCTFCSITMHEGRVIQSRSPRSILAEVKAVAAGPGFKGTISDLGGPTANMYRMRCTRPEVEAVCKRLSCIHPTVCKLLGTDHGPTIELMRAARAVPGVKRVHIASGIRMDLANLDDRYVS